jgi:hypothetical protein
MRRLLKAFLTSLVLLAAGGAGAASISSEVVATVTVTNASGTSNGQTIAYSTDTRTHTNNPTVDTSKFIQTTNSIGAAATNLALHFVRAKFGDGVTLVGTGTNSIKFLSQLNSNLTISVSAGWATVTYKTNLYTNMVALRSPIKSEPNRATATNNIDGIVDAIPWSTVILPEFITSFSNYVSLSATQTLLNKIYKGGSATNVELKGVIVNPYAGGTNGYGIRFGNNWLINDGFQLSLVQGDGMAAEPTLDPHIITLYWGNLIYPTRGGTNVWQGPNTWFGSNWFRGGLRGTNVDLVNGTLTNFAGAFSSLTASNFTGLGGYLSNLFGNSITLSNAPVIHVLNLQALGGYLSNVFANSITLSNANVNGVIGLITGGSWSNATITGLSASNSVFGGTNVVTGDISYPWYDLNTIGAGNNIAVPLGTNAYVALSGNGAAAALCGFAGSRNGKPVKLLNRSGFAMSLVQTTIDPVPANRVVGNIAGDLSFNPGEWVDIVWDNSATRWRFVVPLAAGTNFVTSGRNDTNLHVFASSSNNVALTVHGVVNQNTNIEQWVDGSSNIVASITSTGTVFTAGNAAIINTNNQGAGRVMRSDAGGVGRWNNQNNAISFGDGLDGAAIMDGSIVPAGTTLVAANIYRLDRDVYYTSLYVSNNVTFKTGNHAGSAAYRVFVTGTITNAGTIQNAGIDGTSATAPNTAGAAGTGGASTGTLGGSTGGGAGRAGGTGVGIGGGSASPAADPSVGGTSGTAGAGGNGTSGGGGGGATAAYQLRRHTYVSQDFFGTSSGGTLSLLRGGNGGGGGGAGGGNGTGNGGASGGGGSGGGILFICGQTIVNSGTISANGGVGGNGISPTVAGGGAQGGGAGGSGAGGGLAFLVYCTLSNSGTITANGGAFGTGAAGANGGTAGANGTGGSNGEVLKFNVNSGVFE